MSAPEKWPKASPPPPDVVACGANPARLYCDACIDAYRNGIEPGESACDGRPENAAAPGTIALREMPMWELERTLEAISDLIVCKAWPEHDATFRIARMAVREEINRRTYGTTKG